MFDVYRFRIKLRLGRYNVLFSIPAVIKIAKSVFANMNKILGSWGNWSVGKQQL